MAELITNKKLQLLIHLDFLLFLFRVLSTPFGLVKHLFIWRTWLTKAIIQKQYSWGVLAI